MQETIGDLMTHFWFQDVKPRKGNCIWTNKIIGPRFLAEKPDRFLVQASLGNRLVLSSSIIPSITDHGPIYLEISAPESHGPLPFRFSSVWMEHQIFEDLISSSCTTLKVYMVLKLTFGNKK